MAVRPAEGDLDYLVKFIEKQIGGQFQPTPQRRLGVLQVHPDLIGHRPCSEWTALRRYGAVRLIRHRRCCRQRLGQRSLEPFLWNGVQCVADVPELGVVSHLARIRGGESVSGPPTLPSVGLRLRKAGYRRTDS